MTNFFTCTDKSNEDNFEFEACFEDGMVLTFIRSRRTDGGGKIQIRNTLTGSKREYYFFQIPKKYQYTVDTMKRDFHYPEKLMPTPQFLSGMDWKAFNAQREVLAAMMEKRITATERCTILGLLSLADDMVNYAVDFMEVPPPSPDARFRIETTGGIFLDAAETKESATGQAGRLKKEFGIKCRVKEVKS